MIYAANPYSLKSLTATLIIVFAHLAQNSSTQLNSVNFFLTEVIRIVLIIYYQFKHSHHKRESFNNEERVVLNLLEKNVSSIIQQQHYLITFLPPPLFPTVPQHTEIQI